MQTVAPALFADKLEWRCRNIGGETIETGCGEKGTSKTCTKCGFWKPDLALAKTYECSHCGDELKTEKLSIVIAARECILVLREEVGKLNARLAAERSEWAKWAKTTQELIAEKILVLQQLSLFQTNTKPLKPN